MEKQPKNKRMRGTQRPVTKPASLNVSRLAALGLELQDFIDESGTGERCVDRIEPNDVVLDLGSRLVRVPRIYLPNDLTDGQWVVFKRTGDEITCQLDIEATLEGQSKLTDLFARLTLTDDE